MLATVYGPPHHPVERIEALGTTLARMPLVPKDHEMPEALNWSVLGIWGFLNNSHSPVVSTPIPLFIDVRHLAQACDRLNLTRALANTSFVGKSLCLS
jgi:hypothetical protein